VTEAKYLGIHLAAGRKVVCNFEKPKIKYYWAANSILGKLGKQDNSSVTVHLLSIALPILTYGLEALAPNKTDIISLDHSWSPRASMKIYGTVYKEILKQCQFCTGTLAIKHHTL